MPSAIVTYRGRVGFPRPGRVLVLLVTLLTLAAAAAASAAPANAADTGAVLDAGGQRQWISCTGSGSPTVVISSGLRADHTMWRKVIGPIGQRTRVCIADRPGLGSSPARRGDRTVDAGRHAAELKAVLDAAGEQGPYVLVGHSYAGLIVRAFAAEHPDDVAGVLLLDAVWPGIHREMGSGYASPWNEGGTKVDIAASSRAARGGPDLGATPLIVISAGDPAKVTSRNGRLWNRRQADAARLSSLGALWFAKDSGHVIQLDQPRIVVRAVDRLLAQARDGGSVTSG